MTTATETETETFASVVHDYAGREGVAPHPRAIAEAIIGDQPDIWSVLPYETQVYALTTIVRKHYQETPRQRAGIRSQRIVDPSGEVGTRIRIAAGGPAVWDLPWLVGQETKETRDLSKADIEWLIRDRNQRRVALAAQMKWLMSCLSMAREYAVDTLGQLEKRGVALPVLDVLEDEL